MAKEKTKKSRRRINALDVVIILLVICLIGTVGYRIYKGVSDPDINKESKYIVEYECDGVYNSVADYIKVGDAVYFASSGELLGSTYLAKGDSSVFEIITDAVGEEETETETGEAEEPIAYEKVKAVGKLKLNADTTYNKTGNIYEIGDISFTEGTVIEVYTQNAVFTLKITSIYAIE